MYDSKQLSKATTNGQTQDRSFFTNCIFGHLGRSSTIIIASTTKRLGVCSDSDWAVNITAAHPLVWVSRATNIDSAPSVFFRKQLLLFEQLFWLKGKTTHACQFLIAFPFYWILSYHRIFFLEKKDSLSHSTILARRKHVPISVGFDRHMTCSSMI